MYNDVEHVHHEISINRHLTFKENLQKKKNLTGESGPFSNG